MPQSHRSLLLVGDSDIARWPPRLLPFACHDDDDDDDHCDYRLPEKQQNLKPPVRSKNSCYYKVSGYNGATMVEILEAVLRAIQEWKEAMLVMSEGEIEGGCAGGGGERGRPRSRSLLYLVICAGENDIGNGVRLEETAEHLSLLLGALCGAVGRCGAEKDDDDRSGSASTSGPQRTASEVAVVFLGPKLEPWLVGDMDSRKQYIRLSRALESRCNDASNRPTMAGARTRLRVHFVDCLAMFCLPDSVNRPGALMGGQAIPDASYFDDDQLHLNEEGYLVWKQAVEEALLSVGWTSDSDATR